jgi:hypothetical protein
VSVQLVPARLTHVGPIAANMRALDRLECEALGRSPKDALRNGLRCSLSAITVIEGGQTPIAMLGVVPTAVLGGRGTVWMLGTERVFQNGRALLQLGPLVLADWLDQFGRLENIISADNDRAIRLLRKWGFTIGEAEQVFSGVRFVPFWLERAAIQCARLAA